MGEAKRQAVVGCPEGLISVSPVLHPDSVIVDIGPVLFPFRWTSKKMEGVLVVRTAFRKPLALLQEQLCSVCLSLFFLSFPLLSDKYPSLLDTPIHQHCFLLFILHLAT